MTKNELKQILEWVHLAYSDGLPWIRNWKGETVAKLVRAGDKWLLINDSGELTLVSPEIVVTSLLELLREGIQPSPPPSPFPCSEEEAEEQLQALKGSIRRRQCYSLGVL